MQLWTIESVTDINPSLSMLFLPSEPDQPLYNYRSAHDSPSGDWKQAVLSSIICKGSEMKLTGRLWQARRPDEQSISIHNEEKRLTFAEDLRA